MKTAKLMTAHKAAFDTLALAKKAKISIAIWKNILELITLGEALGQAADGVNRGFAEAQVKRFEALHNYLLSRYEAIRKNINTYAESENTCVSIAENYFNIIYN